MIRVMDPKSPNEDLDYMFDWTKWLLAAGDGDTIVSCSVSATCVMVETSSVVNGTRVIAILSGGAAGTRAVVTCTITTAANRVASRTMVIPIKNL